MLLNGVVIASVVRDGSSTPTIWTAGFLTDLPLWKKPSPLTEAEHTFGSRLDRERQVARMSLTPFSSRNPLWKTEEGLSAFAGEVGRIVVARFEGASVPSIRNEDIELEARAMLRERIERTPWFQHGMTKKQRQAAIEREVDRIWHLFIFDAAQRLVDRAAQGQQA